MKRTRTPFQLPDSVHRQLNMYALAASAAGVGVLALSQPAEAKIVYTKTLRVIENGQHYNLDLNNDKVTDFVLSNFVTCSPDGAACWEVAGLTAAAGNGAVANHIPGSWIFASAMKAGDRIGSKRRFYAGGSISHCDSSVGCVGSWYKTGNRYLGLNFVIKGKHHYGWARLKITGNFQTTMKITLTGYAYETIPNKPIIAGKTKGPDVVTVQPDSLGRLARGSAGLAAGRQKESTNGTH